MVLHWLMGQPETAHITPWNAVIADRHADATARMLLGACGPARRAGSRRNEAIIADRERRAAQMSGQAPRQTQGVLSARGTDGLRQGEVILTVFDSPPAKPVVRGGPAARAIVLASAIAGVGSAGLATAQPCTPESVAERPGQWSQRAPDLAFAREVAPPAQHAAILKRIEPMAAMFREAYPEPRGTEAAGYASIRRFGKEIPDGPAPYGYGSLYKTWLCPKNTRQPSLADETGNWAYAQVNSLNSLLHEHGEMQVDGRRVWTLARRIGELRGETLYETWMGLRYGRGLVFAREGRYPWKPVSQKQYLDAIAAIVQKTIAASSSAVDDAERAMVQQLAEIKRTMTGEVRDQIVAEMERGLAQVRAQRLKTDAKAAGALDEELGYIRTYQASHSQQEMQQPAVVSSGGMVFRGFTKESEDGHLVVQVDPTYFRGDLAPEAAQLVVLLWRWEGDSQASDAWRNSFERRFPIDRLRAMLDR